MSSNINRSEGVNEKTIPPPEEFIKHNIGRKVIVKLQNEEEYKGNYNKYNIIISNI